MFLELNLKKEKWWYETKYWNMHKIQTNTLFLLFPWDIG